MEDLNNKIPKGYRLRVSTHNLLRELVLSTGSNYDTIISAACILLEKEIRYIKAEESDIYASKTNDLESNL